VGGCFQLSSYLQAQVAVRTGGNQIVSFSGLVAVRSGAAVGAWPRWWLGLLLDAVFPAIPLGTLSANLFAGFVIGVLMELFAQTVEVPPGVHLLLIIGFLGALSTFSTFLAEVVALLLRKDHIWAAAVAAHVVGSLALTILGIFVVLALWATEVS